MPRPVPVFFFLVATAISAAFDSELLLAQSPSAQAATNDARAAAHKTCRSCAPMCRQAVDESLPALSNIKTRFPIAACRP
jgi:hypothetical protein